MNYPDIIDSLLLNLKNECSEVVGTVAKLLQQTVDGGGMLFVFGAGHSSILVEEAFHRAGGLIPVYPMLHPFLSPHVSPKIAGKLERLEGVAKIVFAHSRIKKGDLLFIASNSGINAAAIEIAVEAKQAGIKTVAFTSMGHSAKAVSRHPSGKKLFELCDHVIDNHCPQGDALVEIAKVRVGAGSTIANSFLYHWVLTETCKLWEKTGKPLPIYISANLPGGDEANEKNEAAYRNRIPLL